jgi:hypothetical protein
MPLSDETADLDEVAAAIGRTPEWLRRHWIGLHRRENFPRRIPGTWRFPRLAVLAWLRAAGEARVAPEPANQNGLAFVDAYAAALLERQNRK